MTTASFSQTGQAQIGQEPIHHFIEDARNPLVALMGLTKRLVEVIVAENAVLNNRKRASDAKHLIEEKSRLASAYAREMDVMRKNGGARAFGTADQLRELKRETAAFHQILDDHKQIVERARTLTEGMLKAVGDEVAKRNQPAQGYNKTAAPAKPRIATPTSLTLNEVI